MPVARFDRAHRTDGELPERLLTWFHAYGRDLPWRSPSCTPWGVLVSEIMLQQTPVVRVEPAWRRWMEQWPTPGDLAAAGTADVLRAWDRLGYPRRALRLQECARTLVDEHNGRVPDTEATLVRLPGIGPYTAAAIVAFAYHRRSVVLDTNVRRVLTRLVDGAALPPPTMTVAERARAETLVPADDNRASAWAAATMELGALVCTARAPRCEDCPVAQLCRWRAAGYPPDAWAHRRRTQAWEGTDRQVRGRIMAELRAADHRIPATMVASVCADPVQRDRALAGLVADGLVVREEPEVPPDGDTGTVFLRLPS